MRDFGANGIRGTRTMKSIASTLLCLLLVACAAQPEERTPLAWSATRMRADAYYNQGQMLDALPLYEDLHKNEPRNAYYAGRLAYCLLARFESLPTGRERTAAVAQAKRMAERAKALGDNSNLTQTVLDRVKDPAALENLHDAKLQAAEALFVRGEMDAALAAYKEIAAEDPRSYGAHLFAGDVYYRKRDYTQAGEWFQKAILIEPNAETAYRYWGDALAASGDKEAALSKFIDAVVAEPYSRKSWAGLTQWAKGNSATVSHPEIVIPTSLSGKDGKTINIDATALAKPEVAAPWLIYAASRSAWRENEFRKHFPEEKKYRRSLAEEVAALRVALTTVADQEVTDPTLKQVAQFEKDGMLEAFVLISAPDNEIALDYAAFRNDNREILRNYVQKYVVKRNR
jgi:tetratricopeptide (TPR) repeat protein